MKNKKVDTIKIPVIVARHLAWCYDNEPPDTYNYKLRQIIIKKLKKFTKKRWRLYDLSKMQ